MPDLFDRISPAVNGDHQFHALVFERTIHYSQRKTVPFIPSARHHKFRKNAKTVESMDQQDSTGDPIDIVIADYHDLLLIGHRLSDPLNRFLKASQFKRVIQVPQLGL